MTRVPRWLTAAAGLAVVVLLTGVALYVWGVRTATFGWFADAPLTDDVLIPEPPPGLARQRAGEVLIAVGLLGSGFVAGVLAGALGRGRKLVSQRRAMAVPHEGASPPALL